MGNGQIKKVKQLKKGDIVVGIYGPSGVGKSTFLRSLAFLEPNIQGDFIVGDHVYWRDGKVLNPDFNSIRKSFAYIFQELYLWQHLSVIENVSLPIRLNLEISKNEADEKALALLDLFKIAQYKNKHPSEISGGEGQRLAWARALSLNPKLLFVDEGTSALDQNTRDYCLDLTLNKFANISLVLVSHDVDWLKNITTKSFEFERNHL